MKPELTVPEKILTCAAALDSEKGVFTAEDLVVRCWQRFPQTFGLQGYAGDYPDSNRVLTNIMGGKGLRQRGWLHKVGEKRYRLTEVGRQVATQAGIGGEPTGERRAALARDTVDRLERIIKSRALQKFRLGQDLTFGDLSSFWNVSPRSNASQFKTAVGEAAATLAIAEGFAKSNQLESFILPGGCVEVTRADLRLANELQTHLQEVFAREIAIIRERSDERLPR